MVSYPTLALGACGAKTTLAGRPCVSEPGMPPVCRLSPRVRGPGMYTHAHGPGMHAHGPGTCSQPAAFRLRCHWQVWNLAKEALHYKGITDVMHLRENL